MQQGNRFGVAGAAAAFIALASMGAQAEEQSADPRIGEEVNRICFRPNINGWRTIDNLDNAVLLQRGVNDWYYVELIGACDRRVLRSAIEIGIDSRPGANCITRGDIIIVRDTPGLPRRCNVRGMYAWDDDAEAPESEETETGN